MVGHVVSMHKVLYLIPDTETERCWEISFLPSSSSQLRLEIQVYSIFSNSVWTITFIYKHMKIIAENICGIFFYKEVCETTNTLACFSHFITNTYSKICCIHLVCVHVSVLSFHHGIWGPNSGGSGLNSKIFDLLSHFTIMN